MAEKTAEETLNRDVAVGPQYDTTHVYVTPENHERFVGSFVSTFGGTTTKPSVIQITPTPSQTLSQLIFAPVGTLSVMGFKTPIPFPFGTERTGYLVTDMETAVRSAISHGADLLVSPFDDVYGSDAIVQWPGGINMQFYTHKTPPSYSELETVPENRIYLSKYRVEAFLKSFVGFSHGTVTSDDARASGVGIGRPSDAFRRVCVESKFGKLVLAVTNGQLPYPYGREVTGYEVADLSETLSKAKEAGAVIVDGPYKGDERSAAILRFPGGYIAEVHSG